MLLTPVGGWLADRFGASRILAAGNISGLVLAFPIFAMVSTGEFAYGLLGIAAGYALVIPCTSGAQGAFLTELFLVSVRFSGIALAREMNGAIVAGLSPLIAAALLQAGNGHRDAGRLPGPVLPVLGRGDLRRTRASTRATRTEPTHFHRRRNNQWVNPPRQLPDAAELVGLMKFKPPPPIAGPPAPASAADLWICAGRCCRTPTAAFDYVDGAAGREITARRAREVSDYRRAVLPRILHGTAHSDLSTTIAGGNSALPSASPRPASPVSCTPKAKSAARARR